MNFAIRIVTGALLAAGLGLNMTTMASAENQVVRIGFLKIAGLANAWVAKQEGIFNKHGLDAELIEFRDGSDAVAANQAGEVDIILSQPGITMTAVQRGFDFVAVVQNEAAKAQGPDTGSIQVKADSEINSLAGLAGKKVAMSGLFSQNSIATRTLLKNAGVDLDTVQFIEMPYSSQTDALRVGQVDAAVVVDPFTTRLQTSGLGKVLAWSYAESIPEQPLGVWYARRTFIEQNPELVEHFAAAIRDSIDYMNADPARARAKVAEFTGLDVALVESMPMINWTYEVKPELWQKVADMMAAMDVINKDYDVMGGFSEQMKTFIVK